MHRDLWKVQSRLQMKRMKMIQECRVTAMSQPHKKILLWYARVKHTYQSIQRRKEGSRSINRYSTERSKASKRPHSEGSALKFRIIATAVGHENENQRFTVINLLWRRWQPVGDRVLHSKFALNTRRGENENTQKYKAQCVVCGNE